MKKTNFKKGLSMIVIIITIVVIIILAVTVILTLNKNNPINSAKEASFKAQVVAYRDSVLLAKMEIVSKNQGDYDISNDKTIQDGLGLKTEFANSLFVKDGKLVFIPDVPESKKTIFDSIGINAGCQIPISGKLHKEFDSNGQITNFAPVPEGFVVSSDPAEDTIVEGLVIKQGSDPASTTSNEFVWVPVKNPATEYKRGVIGQGAISANYTENDSDPTNIAIKNSVIKYNGFYIGRYETGLSDKARYINTDVDGTKWTDVTPVVKKGARPWNYISQTKAIDISKDIVNTTSVKSTLINSYMWDTTLNYIISSKAKTQDEVISDSTSWGNCKNATFSFEDASYSTNLNDYANVTSSISKPIDTSWLLTAGATNRNLVKNIYDLAGNLFEWTTEINRSLNNATLRGGGCNYNGYYFSAIFCNDFSISYIKYDVGFRSVLYIL